MKTLLFVLVALIVALVPMLLATPAVAEQEAEAIEVLKKVDAAIKAVDSVKFDVEMTPSGIATTRTGPAKGTVIIQGYNGQMPERFRVDLEMSRPGTEGLVKLSASGNGEEFVLIDHTTKKSYADMDPAVLGSAQNALFGVAMIEFVHDHPFDDELGGDVVELLGMETIGDEECYKIRVIYSGGQGESIWSFSKEDYLPRKRVQVFSTPQGDGGIERTISNLEVGYEGDAATFAMKLPAGYEQIDDFAP